MTERPCPRCGTRVTVQLAAGTTHHYAKVVDGAGHFLAWAPWPRDGAGRKLPRPTHLTPALEEQP